MAQVFVANPTQLHTMFQYRPFRGSRLAPCDKLIHVSVRAGGQERLPTEHEGAELEYVIAQIRTFGGVPADEPRSLKSSVGLVYSVKSKPITIDQLDGAAERNEEVRQEVAEAQFEAAGLAAFRIAESVLPGAAEETTLTVIEKDDNGTVKGGVNAEVTVSKKARGRRTTTRHSEE
jgi:hypothetical protein